MPRARNTASIDIEKWSAKAKRNLHLVVMEATSVVYKAMTTRQPSVTETDGAYVIGKVPVDLGYLIGSATVALNGAETVGSPGQPAVFMAAVSGMKMGDVIEAYFTAEYAPHIEYGTVHFGGRFMVREAAAKFIPAVERAAKRYIDD